MTTERYEPFQSLKKLIQQSSVSERVLMNRSLLRVSHWRQQLLVNTFKAKQGNTVHSGPFAGMTYQNAAEGALLPRLIGCYEAELHPTIMQLKEEKYQHVIDIGCAEGYYAVGLARLLENCQVHAYDVNEAAQVACKALAKANQVDDRVSVGGLFEGDNFTFFKDQKTLLFCDIEGAEEELLDPLKYPALVDMDLIVEVHECYRKGLMQKITDRFTPTHDIEWIWQSESASRDLPQWTRDLTHLDQILCTWEWRQGPTPWAVMRSKARAPKRKSDPLPVVFAIHDADGQYWINAAVAMSSVGQHASVPLHFHVLHDDTLKPEARARLSAVAKQVGAELSFKQLALPESIEADELHRFSPASLFRLMIPQLFAHEPVVLYLDVDLVSHGVDVKALVEAMPAEAPIAGVVDPFIAIPMEHQKALKKLQLDYDHYINSGVLVMRPCLIKEDLLLAFVRFFETNPDSLHPDQDFLNLHFLGRFGDLPSHFNQQVGIFEKTLFWPLSDYSQKIIHFSGKLKPLQGNLAPGLMVFWMYTQWVPEAAQALALMRYIHPMSNKPHAVSREWANRPV